DRLHGDLAPARVPRAARPEPEPRRAALVAELDEAGDRGADQGPARGEIEVVSDCRPGAPGEPDLLDPAPRREEVRVEAGAGVVVDELAALDPSGCRAGAAAADGRGAARAGDDAHGLSRVLAELGAQRGRAPGGASGRRRAEEEAPPGGGRRV